MNFHLQHSPLRAKCSRDRGAVGEGAALTVGSERALLLRRPHRFELRIVHARSLPPSFPIDGIARELCELNIPPDVPYQLALCVGLAEKIHPRPVDAALVDQKLLRQPRKARRARKLRYIQCE